MRSSSRVTTILAIAAALVGLAVSVALAIDYLGPAPAYCAEGGCLTVRASTWSHPLGIPTPILGAAFFATMLALIALGPRAARVRRVAAIGGGAIAIALIILQGAVIGAWCELCLIVDTSAIALAALAAATTVAPARRARTFAIAGLAAAAIAAPITIAAAGWGAEQVATSRRFAALPDVVRRAQVPGELTIVEFVDFECPFCRALHGRLTAALAETGRKVRVVRKMVPIRAHPHAMPAAIAWCGADAQGRGDAMAEALLAADPESLTPEGCEQIAARLGLDLAKYRAVCAAPATAERIAGDTAAARAAGVKVLPTVYIGATAFSGAKATKEDLAAALRGA